MVRAQRETGAKTNRIYRRRRDLLVHAGSETPGLQVRGSAVWIQLLLPLAEDTDEVALAPGRCRSGHQHLRALQLHLIRAKPATGRAGRLRPPP